MNKNYYDILEINKNASPEIIEKAYKTLAKKYHPDLQNEANKSEAEEILKQINEAYETLSNSDKRRAYDENLKNNEISQEDAQRIFEENINLQNELNNIKNNPNINTNSFNINNYQNNSTSNTTSNFEQANRSLKERIAYERELQNARQQAYYDAYIQDLKNRGYKIRYKHTFKDFLALLITFFILIVICFIVWHIPFTKNYLINLYNENKSLQTLVDFIFNLFT